MDGLIGACIALLGKLCDRHGVEFQRPADEEAPAQKEDNGAFA